MASTRSSNRLLLRAVVDRAARVRGEDAHHGLEAAVVALGEEAADLGHDLDEVIVDGRPADADERGVGGVDGEQLGDAEREGLELFDGLVETIDLLLLADLLLDEGEVAVERREVALDGGLAGLQLLGELLDAVRLGRVGEQPQERPLPDQLLRVRTTFTEVGKRTGHVCIVISLSDNT